MVKIKNKKILLYFLIIAIILTSLLLIFIYNNKNNSYNLKENKVTRNDNLAIYIKEINDTEYVRAATKDIPKGNYVINMELSTCKNNGVITSYDANSGTVNIDFIGTDSCKLYFYYEKPFDIKLNIEDTSYLLGTYSKSISNCNKINSSDISWNNKLNGFEVANVNNTKANCDLVFTPKTVDNSELLSTKASTAGTSGNGTIVESTHGYRYQGNNPDNYVWFNDEMWRIIGYVPVCLTSGCTSTENRVKIIRNSSIGGLVYKANTTSDATWTASTIQKLLNTCYLGKKSDTDSTCASYCYSYYRTSEKPVAKCDYSSIGINASDYYGNMIESVYWNVGEPSSATFVSADDQYTKEIASYTSSTSKIGLMYASDWGYAIEGYTEVLGSSGSSYNYMNKNWLFSNGYEWTMSAYSSSQPLYVYKNGYLVNSYSYIGYAARPVLYLKSNVYVVSGSGSESDPYIIGM
ncbi:MAG: hypothetical protein PUD07_04015 [bacterium]|nr:hypothetical protein [bacterium]